MKIVNIDGENPQKIFRKDVTYSNIKKKQVFIFSLEDTILEKPQGGSNWPLSQFQILNFLFHLYLSVRPVRNMT